MHSSHYPIIPLSYYPIIPLSHYPIIPLSHYPIIKLFILNPDALTNTVYLFSAVALLLGLRLMTARRSARRGLYVAAAGLVSALIATLLDPRVERFEYILGGLALGVFAGIRLVRRRAEGGQILPAMALLTACGGLAALFSGWAEFHAHAAGQGAGGGILLWLIVVLGGLVATGSLAGWRMAAMLQGETLSQAGTASPGLPLRAVLTVLLVAGILFARDTVAPEAYRWFALAAAFALLLGYLWVAALEPALIPAALALMAAGTGLAACALGLILQHPLLIAAGGLAGGSGVALARSMCVARQYPFSALLGKPVEKNAAETQEAAGS